MQTMPTTLQTTSASNSSKATRSDLTSAKSFKLLLTKLLEIQGREGNTGKHDLPLTKVFSRGRSLQADPVASLTIDAVPSSGQLSVDPAEVTDPGQGLMVETEKPILLNSVFKRLQDVDPKLASLIEKTLTEALSFDNQHLFKVSKAETFKQPQEAKTVTLEEVVLPDKPELLLTLLQNMAQEIYPRSDFEVEPYETVPTNYEYLAIQAAETTGSQGQARQSRKLAVSDSASTGGMMLSHLLTDFKKPFGPTDLLPSVDTQLFSPTPINLSPNFGSTDLLPSVSAQSSGASGKNSLIGSRETKAETQETRSGYKKFYGSEVPLTETVDQLLQGLQGAVVSKGEDQGPLARFALGLQVEGNELGQREGARQQLSALLAPTGGTGLIRKLAENLSSEEAGSEKYPSQSKVLAAKTKAAIPDLPGKPQVQIEQREHTETFTGEWPLRPAASINYLEYLQQVLQKQQTGKNFAADRQGITLVSEPSSRFREVGNGFQQLGPWNTVSGLRDGAQKLGHSLEALRQQEDTVKAVNGSVDKFPADVAKTPEAKGITLFAGQPGGQEKSNEGSRALYRSEDLITGSGSHNYLPSTSTVNPTDDVFKGRLQEKKADNQDLFHPKDVSVHLRHHEGETMRPEMLRVSAELPPREIPGGNVVFGSQVTGVSLENVQQPDLRDAAFNSEHQQFPAPAVKLMELKAKGAKGGFDVPLLSQEDGYQQTVTLPDQSAKIPSAEKPVDMARLTFELVSRLRMNASQGRSEAEIQLEPEHLGKIHVKLLVLEEGKMLARFLVENHQVAQFLNHHVSQLRQDLQAQGFDPQQINVQVGDGGTEQQQFGWQRQQERKSDFNQNGRSGADNLGEQLFLNNSVYGLDLLA